MKMKSLLTILILSYLMFILFGCGRGSAPTAITSSGSQTATTGAGEFTGKIINGVRVIDVKAVQFKFIPDVIRVKKGEKVKLNLTSGDVLHGFDLDDFKISVQIPPGKTTTAEFTPDKTGTFIFDCSVYCGVGHGNMKGKLIVSEN
jgi:cytochrome c oxidase subunit II